MAAIPNRERNPSPTGLVRLEDLPRERLTDPRDGEPTRAFTEWRVTAGPVLA